jgi:hypothetical protein
VRVVLVGLTMVAVLLFGLVAIPISEGADEETIIEPGFAYRDMEFSVMHPYEVLGTIINRSGRNYRNACFMMKLYNKDDRLLKVADFCVTDLSDGQSKLFRTSIYTNPTVLKGYKILFRSGF